MFVFVCACVYMLCVRVCVACVCVCGLIFQCLTALVMSEGVNGNTRANSYCDFYIWRINFLVSCTFPCRCFQAKGKGAKLLPPTPHPPETPGGFTDLETDEDFDGDDETNDPNWRFTPLFNRKPLKVEFSIVSAWVRALSASGD